MPAQPLSSSKKHRYPAVCIFKLFKKWWSTFYFEMDNRFPASYQQNFDEIQIFILQRIDSFAEKGSRDVVALCAMLDLKSFDVTWLGFIA